jgi:hypothetical protein
MGEWRYSSIILDLGTRWRWVVSFTTLPRYPRGRGPRYPLDRRLGEPQSRSGRCGEEKNLALPGIEPVARRYTDWAIPTAEHWSLRDRQICSVHVVTWSISEVCGYSRCPVSRSRCQDSSNYSEFPKTELKLNSVALVRERTIPTERPPLIGEVVPTSGSIARNNDH